jgi:hypothetical protein
MILRQPRPPDPQVDPRQGSAPEVFHLDPQRLYLNWIMRGAKRIQYPRSSAFIRG